MTDSEQTHSSKEEKVSLEALSFNNRQFDMFRTVLFLVGGILSGVLGLTGLNGLFMYLAVAVASALSLICRMGFRQSRYTTVSTLGFTTGSLSNYALSYVLFWTLSYALVHIY